MVLSRLRVLALVPFFALLSTPSAHANASNLTVKGTAQLSAGNTQATVTGLVQCPISDIMVDIYASIQQGKGGQFVFAQGVSRVFCTGSAEPYSVVVSTRGQTLQSGLASVNVIASIMGTDPWPVGVQGPLTLY